MEKNKLSLIEKSHRLYKSQKLCVLKSPSQSLFYQMPSARRINRFRLRPLIMHTDVASTVGLEHLCDGTARVTARGQLWGWSAMAKYSTTYCVSP